MVRVLGFGTGGLDRKKVWLGVKRQKRELPCCFLSKVKVSWIVLRDPFLEFSSLCLALLFTLMVFV